MSKFCLVHQVDIDKLIKEIYWFDRMKVDLEFQDSILIMINRLYLFKHRVQENLDLKLMNKLIAVL